MRIGGIGARPPRADDVAAAIVGAAGILGQRPAITAVGPGGRQEQGFHSLAGWVAKGANLLQQEFGLRPGDPLGLGGPPDWPMATVALAAWWSGITIVPAGTPGTGLTVLHVATPAADARAPADGEVLWIGDASDGSGEPPVRGQECWVDAVTPYPDRPPPPAHDGGLVAVRLHSGHAPTQRELLEALASDAGGTIGLLRHGGADLVDGTDAALLLATLALRPFVTGAATVIVDADDPDRQRIGDAERVTRWVG